MDKKRNSIFLSFYFYSYSLLVLHHNFTFSITSTAAAAVAANVSSYYLKEERGNSYKSNAVQMQKHLNQLFALKSILWEGDREIEMETQWTTDTNIIPSLKKKKKMQSFLSVCEDWK